MKIYLYSNGVYCKKEKRKKVVNKTPDNSIMDLIVHCLSLLYKFIKIIVEYALDIFYGIHG